MVWTPIGHVASYLAWLCKLLAESSSYHFSSDVTGQGSKREGECFHSLPEYWAGEKLCLMNSMTLLHVLKASCFFPHIFVLATACSRSAINVRRNPANLVTNTVREWECKMWSFLCSLLWQLFFFVFLGWDSDFGVDYLDHHLAPLCLSCSSWKMGEFLVFCKEWNGICESQWVTKAYGCHCWAVAPVGALDCPSVSAELPHWDLLPQACVNKSVFGIWSFINVNELERERASEREGDERQGRTFENFICWFAHQIPSKSGDWSQGMGTECPSHKWVAEIQQQHEL